ncbi:tetratricopeptide repeat-containing sensor histidine kinase [Yeosuana marina]|uniref:tetratricopeptide repeat-containing sensor histidine kinase n=1 Tax=Yeosuana marina TaxID=1565536 RepID=UPI0030C882E3
MITAQQSKEVHQKYRDSIASEIKTIKSDSLRADRYYIESNYAMRILNDLQLGRSYIDSAFYYSKQANHKDLEAKCHFMYGVLERVEGNYQKALEHLDKNIRYFENDSTLKAYALFQVGVIHNEVGDFENSLKTYLEILEIFETKKDSFAIASTFNSIAVVHGEMNQNKKAIENFKKALVLFEKLDNKQEISNTLMNLGEMYSIEEDKSKSREYLQKSLAIAREVNDVRAMILALQTLGKSYLNDQSQMAFRYLSEAEELLKTTNLPSAKTSVFRDLGHYYKSKKNYAQAIKYYKNALQIANNTKELINQKELNKCLSDIYNELNDFEKAFIYKNQYIAFKDSIFNKEKVKAINLLQIQFETEKKDKELAEQQLVLEQKETELIKKKSQNTFMTVLAALFFVTAIMGWFVYHQRQKRKNQEILTLKREHQIKALEALIEGEENERFRIAKELHDGVNGDLSVIKYKLSSLLEMNNNVIKEAIAMIDDSCKQVRAISHDLVPPSLENFNLVEATEVYCSNLNETNLSTEIVFQNLGDDINLSKKDEINIFRIIQELVTNSLKHANSTKINAQISNRNNHIQITIEDDGVGFNKDEVMSKGIGLSNVQSRIEYLNASMDLISNKNGTSYTIDIDKEQLNEN